MHTDDVQPLHPALDLFGEVPVTWPEVWDWLEAVPRIPRDSPRAAHYVEAYGVVGKIQAKKLGSAIHV